MLRGGRGKGEGQFDSPCGICFTADGNLVVAEQDNRRVQIVREGGSSVRSFGSAPAGGENGQFDDHRPCGVSVGPDGSIAVLDKGELPSRVQLFDEEGRFVRSIGEWSIESGGWEPGELMDSTGVAHGTGGEIIVRD
jgi:tripartite motif-containing protein 71